jgi:hypothetical protein
MNLLAKDLLYKDSNKIEYFNVLLRLSNTMNYVRNIVPSFRSNFESREITQFLR